MRSGRKGLAFASVTSVTARLLGVALGVVATSGCLYFEGGGGGAFPTEPSTSTAEATLSGAMGITGDIPIGPFPRGLRLAAGVGTTHGELDLEGGPASYLTGKYHLRVDQTLWTSDGLYLRWTLAGELAGEAWWQDDRMEGSRPLEGSGWGLLTGPTLALGFEGTAERELASDGSVHFTLGFHYGRLDTSEGTVALPGIQLRIALDYDLGGQLAEGFHDGLN